MMDSLLLISLLILLAGFLLIACIFALKYLKTRKHLAGQLLTKEDELTQLNRELHSLTEQINQLTLAEDGVNESERLKASIELTLKKALKRSEEEHFQKNAFLSNLSSEIRTPLNNIIGFASLLETEISLLENKELFEYARGISESGDRLINLLNNIIDISRIESHDVDVVLKPCQVSIIISSVAQLYVFKANDQKIKFNVINKDIPDALVDDKVLNKVLGGIVDNAIKYTEKGFVNISTGYAAKANEVTIRVKDSGTGIDPTYLKEIFDPFRRESAGYSQEVQGSRLGLPIAKRFVEMMNGKIEIDSKKGEGTTVTIFLQAVESPEPEALTEVEEVTVEEEVVVTRRKVLQDLDIFIVEDDLMNSMVLVQMTKGLGKVTTAVNGEATLKIIADKNTKGEVFDIMLFDINLPPPYDGVKLMQKIRLQFPAYKRIPFIAQTAYAMTGDREKLLEAGFDDYIPKPINKNELYTIMKNQLKIR
ncbi:MAG: response regulator [Bacteroidetes bacterium]|nr:MAG: response regulator [Bacteroidota bacterium]